MKRFILWILILCLLTLTACVQVITPQPKSTENATVTDTSTEEDTKALNNEEQTQDQTQEETQEEEPFESYLVQVSRSDFPIYSGPGYDHSPAGTVEVAAKYTIVGESRDADGNLWGKLKSGAGWVDLTLLKNEETNAEPVTAKIADNGLLNNGNFYYCAADQSSHAYKVAFRATRLLSDVSFFSISAVDAYVRGPELFHISNWGPGKPLVVSVYFPSITSMYGIEFTDRTGTHIYTVTESGRDGESVCISPLTVPLLPQETNNPEHLAPWKIAYLDFIETVYDAMGTSDFDLVYLDNDDIPELFISGSCEAAGSMICSYKNGTVVSEHLRRLGGAYYIPKSGLIYNCNGNMGYYSTDIYLLSDSGFTSLFYGLQEDLYEDVIREDGTVDYITNSTYYLYNESGEIQVNEEEYYAAQDEVFPFAQAQGLYKYEALYSQTQIQERIRKW